MQPFGMPIQITLQGGRRHQIRGHFSAALEKKSKIGDGDKTPEKNKKLPSNAGEERAVFLGFAMMGFSVLMFFLLGITILQPFMLSTQREESNCTAIRVHIVDVWLDCSSICAADCWQRGKYPCLQVLVNLSHSAQKVLLYYNEEAVQLNPKCFYTPKCHRARNDLLDSALDLKNFFDQKNGTPFSCFYRSDSKSEDVILTQKYDKMAIFHCLFWPSLTLLGGALIVGMVKLTQHLSFLRDKYPVAIKEANCLTSQAELRRHKMSRKTERKDKGILRWELNSQISHHSLLL